VWSESGGSEAPTTGFGAIYLSHLLVQFPFDKTQWQQMRAMTTRSLIWPVVAAPAIYFFGQTIIWADLILAHDHGMILDPRFATAGDDGTLPLALFGEIGLWPLSVCAVITAILVPLAVRTGNWAEKIYQSHGREAGGPVPKGLPTPEGIADGEILQGEIVDRGGWLNTSGKTRRSYEAFLMKFEAPFDPPVFCGFYFRESSRRRKFCAYLEERQEAGLPIKVRVAGQYDFTIVPLDVDGSDPPSGIAAEIIDRAN
jgi:hypothetical protein